MEKPKIEYPCTWHYKVISDDKEATKASILEALGTIEFRLSESRQSRKGNFTSFSLSSEVTSDAERYRIFELLKGIPSVKMVL